MRGVGDDERRGRVLDDVLEPRAWIGGVERHVEVARLERAEHRGGRGYAARQEYADRLARFASGVKKRAGDPVGRGVEISVAYLAAVPADRGVCRVRLHHLFETLRQDLSTAAANLARKAPPRACASAGR